MTAGPELVRERARLLGAVETAPNLFRASPFACPAFRIDLERVERVSVVGDLELAVGERLVVPSHACACLRLATHQEWWPKRRAAARAVALGDPRKGGGGTT